MEKFGRIALKTILWIIASVLILVLLIVVLLQVPSVQNFAKDKAVTFLQDKIKTKVQIGHISLGLPKLIVLENVYFEDQKKDTLIAGEKLKVDISLLKLLNNKVEVNEINLKGITAKVYRGQDSVFNFDYIIKAFAGGPKTEPAPKDTSAGMVISLDKIILDKINISYKDLTTGNDVKFLLGHFDTRIKDFDLDKMKFSIPKINLSDVNAKIIQTPQGSSIAQAATVDTATAPLDMTLDIGTVDISRIKLDYRSKEMSTKMDLGKLLVEMDDIDLKNQRIGIKNIALNDTKAGLILNKPTTVAEAVVKTAKKIDTLVTAPNSNKPWRVRLERMTFNNDDIKFDNNAQKPIARGLDYGHMDIKGLTTEIKGLSYSPDTIAGRIENLAFNEKSGLKINTFHTTFLYGPKGAYLKDLLLETPNTTLQKSVEVSYPSLDAISKDVGSLGINADLDGSKLGLRDVLLLMPTMASMEPFKSSPGSVFKIDGKVTGKVSDLKIPNIEISGMGRTHIKATAYMRGLPDVNKATFDLDLKDFTTTRGDIFRLAPKGTIPASVSVPENINLKGTFKGGIKNFKANMQLRTNLGAVDLNAIFNGARKGRETYNANVKLKDVNVGALTKQPQMVGRVTANAKVRGTGIDPKNLSLQFEGDVKSVYVKGYNYKDLVMKGTASNGKYDVTARMKDPNINFALNAKADMTQKYPAVNATLLVDSINLQALKFVKDPMRFHGKLIADVPTADPDYLNADISLTDMLLVNKGERIALDTVTLKSTATADSSTLYLKLPMLKARMAGKYKLTEVGTALQDVINKYYNTDAAGGATAAARAKIDSANRAKIKNNKPIKPAYSPQQFTFGLTMVKTPLVSKFVPNLKTLDPVNINGRFDSNTGELTVNGTIPKVVYGTNVVTNGKLNVNTNNNALNYALTVDEIDAGTSLKLLYPSITGSAKDNKLNLNVQVRDADKKERFRIAGVFAALQNEYQFSLLPNGLLLDYTPWTVSPTNALQFGGKGILAKDFAISNAGQTLSINSNTPEYNSPLTVAFTNFKIETLTKMAQQDTLLVGGTINGKAEVSNLQASPQFTAGINIGDFSFKGDTVGNIAIKVNNQTANAFAANVNITGKGNQVTLDGLYYTAPESRMDMSLNIVTLNMKSIEGFSFGAIRRASGNITGQMKITGTPSAPVVRGDVNFNEVGFNVSMLNSYFRMPKESITFNDDGVRFNNFTLIDSLNNKAVVSGTVYTKTYTDFRFGLDINADNFRAVNSTKSDNKLFYGKLFINTRVKIRGTMDKPEVDANLTVNEQTDMTFVLPTNDPAVEDRKGVVYFANANAPKLDSIMLAKQLDSLKKSDITGMDISAQLNVDKNAAFHIVIDERNGDVVHLKGDAQLNAGIDPSGKINLTGTYTVNSGSYALSYATVNRKFDFKNGSTIIWTGDPTSAIVDLTAVYVAKVPPIDLVEQQLTGDETQRTMYKQRLPFNVNLNLKDQLMSPKITFDIVLPDSNYTVSPDVVNTVENRLAQVRQDPNELNKQVLGVLVLGHFIGDNPLASQGGSTGVDGAIRNSVSSLLSDQLNKLAGDLIGGVALSFDLESGADYSTGTQQNRTDLNVGLSKQFLNDRLTVTVGNNFNLEGQNQPGQKATNIAGNLSVNYKLSKDGRYRLRAYRKDEYIVIQGQVVETGVAFSVTADYNRFSQLFRKKTAEERAKQREYNEKEKQQKEIDKAKQDSTDKKAQDGQDKAEQQRKQDTPPEETSTPNEEDEATDDEQAILNNNFREDQDQQKQIATTSSN
ncbi:translocation/assembly module TamB domain-containing protein [Mucilaginibacter myungsuensis]|uniref:Translocation/assembly module TamB domain-containing protein n=1 Tax=Mucilaginibacter myungsuensis TaxID=649104 RepID=A0A929L350_9SPHI|nr:translocation/assembly module TamB [Mucilaginibacter myungsuensis]MBE9662371.1 translocation/assembly module TamB domain-containing protein [Mucilaginibacter myungsuensis]MDN3599192.1 translocation/assembly module TamB domain-containing protein [Mucilaginibacter myungsuensis]